MSSDEEDEAGEQGPAQCNQREADQVQDEEGEQGQAQCNQPEGQETVPCSTSTL